MKLKQKTGKEITKKLKIFYQKDESLVNYRSIKDLNFIIKYFRNF